MGQFVIVRFAAGLAALPTVFKANGVVHAGNSSQISDGAAAVLIASEAACQKYGLEKRAKITTTVRITNG